MDENIQEETQAKPQYDLDKVYTYKELPDKISGRCDNCNHALFKSSVKNFVFLRECANCGMKKSI